MYGIQVYYDDHVNIKLLVCFLLRHSALQLNLENNQRTTCSNPLSLRQIVQKWVLCAPPPDFEEHIVFILNPSTHRHSTAIKSNQVK